MEHGRHFPLPFTLSGGGIVHNLIAVDVDNSIIIAIITIIIVAIIVVLVVVVDLFPTLSNMFVHHIEIRWCRCPPFHCLT